MKRTLSIIVLALFLVTMLPFSAFAAESGEYEREQLLAKACEVFPEYASLIRGGDVATCSLPSGEKPTVISQETRYVSETETLTVARLTDSSVIVTDARYNNSIAITGSSTSNVGPDVIGSASFQVTNSAQSGVFNYNSVGFIITNGASGSFTSYGTPSKNTRMAYNKITESSTNIEYALTFGYGTSAMLYYDFNLYFSGGQLKAYVG